MDQSTCTTGKEQRDFELKMRQSLLILGCLSTLCGFHYESGDIRLLDDLVQRDKDAWFPRVGAEGYESFQDAQTDHSISWKGFTTEFASAFPDALPERPERLESVLRSQLSHVLKEIGQLTIWPRKPSPSRLRQFACKDFNCEMNLWLVLSSSALIPFCGRYNPELWDTQNCDLKQLAEFLNSSCLFNKPLAISKLTATKLKDWIKKLELLFCGPRGERQVLFKSQLFEFPTHKFRVVPPRWSHCIWWHITCVKEMMMPSSNIFKISNAFTPSAETLVPSLENTSTDASSKSMDRQ